MRFRFLRDPLFLASVALYFFNRLVLKAIFPHNEFLHGYLTDCLCLPVWVPLMLWIMRRLNLRGDEPPRWSEIWVPLVFWSLVFEFWLPQTEVFGHFAPGDPFDVMAYAAGGMTAFLGWKVLYAPRGEKLVKRGELAAKI